jgi:hypothetical protein
VCIDRKNFYFSITMVFSRILKTISKNSKKKKINQNCTLSTQFQNQFSLQNAQPLGINHIISVWNQLKMKILFRRWIKIRAKKNHNYNTIAADKIQEILRSIRNANCGRKKMQFSIIIATYIRLKIWLQHTVSFE